MIDDLRNDCLNETLATLNNDLSICNLSFEFKNQYDGTISIKLTHVPSELIHHETEKPLTSVTICYIITPADVQLDAFRHYLTLNCSETILHGFDETIHQFTLLATNQHDELLKKSIKNHAASNRVKLASWLDNLAQ